MRGINRFCFELARFCMLTGIRELDPVNAEHCARLAFREAKRIGLLDVKVKYSRK